MIMTRNGTLTIESILVKHVLPQSGSYISERGDVIGEFLDVADLSGQVILVQEMCELEPERET